MTTQSPLLSLQGVHAHYGKSHILHGIDLSIGRGEVVSLPESETERRWRATTHQWPIMHAVTYGVSRDQMMARHKSNHIQVAYASDAKRADEAMLAKASMAAALGMNGSICGSRKNGAAWPDA